MTGRLLVALLVLAALTGCAGSDPRSSAQPTPKTSVSATPSASPSRTGPPTSAAARRCEGPDYPAKPVTIASTNRMALVGYEVGSGPRGVVLVHQIRGGLCGWWPYAAHLAKAGYHVLLFDMRCFAASPCPDDFAAKERYTDDVAAATAHLRRAGAAQVALVGASIGGSVVLASAVRPPPGVVAAVDLSGSVLDAALQKAVLNLPFYYLAAQGDRSADPEATKPIVMGNRNDDSQLVILEADAGHGWALVYGDGPDGTSTHAADIEKFIAKHLPP